MTYERKIVKIAETAKDEQKRKGLFGNEKFWRSTFDESVKV